MVGFVGAHRYALELFEFAEEVLDEMAPFVEVAIERKRLCAARMLGDNDLGAAGVEIGDDGVAVEGLVGDQAAERDAVEQGRDADRIETVARQEMEADQIAQRVGERVSLGVEFSLEVGAENSLSGTFA